MWTTIASYSGLFGLSMVKFLFASSAGWLAGLSYLEIVLVTGLGALTSFNIFYLGSSFFFKRYDAKREASNQPAKVFTRMNRFIVRLKMSRWGFELVCLLCPLFLSVPGGSLIVARLYGDEKRTYWFTTVSLIAWAFVLPWIWVFLG